jgi:hypothetical protein
MRLSKRKRSQKEEARLLQRLNSPVKNKRSILKWISLIAYPFFMLCPIQKANAQTNKEALIYKQVLQLNFEASRKAIQNTEKELFPSSEIYLNNLNDVLELVFTEDVTRFEALQVNEEKRLEELSRLDKSSPYTGFLAAEIKLQWAFVKLKFNKTWSGVWSLRSAYKLIKENIETHPNFNLNYKTMGLLHVIFGAVPDNQQWVLSILGLEGDVALGLKELVRIDDRESLFKTETNLISALIQSYLLEDHAHALEKLSSSHEKQTLAEVYVASLVYMKAHKAANASVLLQQAITETNDRNQVLPLFHYLLAEGQFQKGDHLSSKKNYLLFQNNSKGLNHKKDAQMKIALCDFYLGNKKEFEQGWQLAKTTKTSEAEADKNAEKILEPKDLPNFELLKIRYAIDGGFYSMANSLIEQIESSPLRPGEQLELAYRKARNAHLSGQLKEASGYYEQVINNNQKLTATYFVPNSFLQIAYIKLTQRDTSEAIIYFNKVLEFKRHPYKNSLDSKAKIALETINFAGG